MIETEFLFGLIPDDPWNQFVNEALMVIRQEKLDVRCLASGLLETIFVAKSYGRKEAQIRKILGAMLSKIKLNGIRLVEPIDVRDLMGCLSLREFYKISFYGALHASSALNRSGMLISNDTTYDVVKGIKRISMRAFVNKRGFWSE